MRTRTMRLEKPITIGGGREIHEIHNRRGRPTMVTIKVIAPNGIVRRRRMSATEAGISEMHIKEVCEAR